MPEPDAGPRFAIYFVPEPATALARFGASAVGYDIWTGREAALCPSIARHPDPDRITQEPGRYGFHATLKAPFHLRKGATQSELGDRASLFASSCKPVVLDRCEVRALSSFLALVPLDPPRSLQDLAAACVREFDDLRAPLSDADRARRLAKPLTQRQRAYLDAWGYPYVLDEFRFHMTLTGAIEPLLRSRIRAGLAEDWEKIAAPVVINAITVAIQPTRSSRFHVAARYAFPSA